MWKLILLAAGFGVGMNAAVAQDVTSEGRKAQGQEQLMQQKEHGTNQSQSGQRDRPGTNYDRTQGQGAQSSGNSSAQSDQQGQSQSNRQTPGSEQVPQQSMPSVGHPKEGGQTGQFGTKRFDESGQSQDTQQRENR